jgi:hypothetical protein
VPKWLNIVWILLPKKYIGRLVLDGLMYLALQTETKIDDEFLKNVEKWLVKEQILDPKTVETIKTKHQKGIKKTNT